MDLVRPKEKRAELLAHVLDDVIRMPGTSLRFGIDPILGLVPVAGDVVTVICGSFIVLTARQLGVPSTELTRMMYRQLVNGLVGAIPVLGDIYSFGFKSHAKNSAALVRALKQGEGSVCQITTPPLRFIDVALVCALNAPVALMAGLVGWWFWESDISLISFLF